MKQYTITLTDEQCASIQANVMVLLATDDGFEFGVYQTGEWFTPPPLPQPGIEFSPLSPEMVARLRAGESLQIRNLEMDAWKIFQLAGVA